MTYIHLWWIEFDNIHRFSVFISVVYSYRKWSEFPSHFNISYMTLAYFICLETFTLSISYHSWCIFSHIYLIPLIWVPWYLLIYFDQVAMSNLLNPYPYNMNLLLFFQSSPVTFPIPWNPIFLIFTHAERFYFLHMPKTHWPNFIPLSNSFVIYWTPSSPVAYELLFF